MATDDSNASELAGAFLDAIGEEAFATTGGDVHRSGQPLLRDPDAPNAGSPPPPESKPVAEAPKPETTPATEPEWFLPGMYKTRDEAIKGFHETKRYASDAVTGRQELAAKVEQLEKVLNPPKPPPDPLSELEAYGVPRAPMERAIQALAQQTVSKMFEPGLRQIQADKQIVSMYPEYETKFGEVAAFVDSNKELSAKVSRAEQAGEYLLARELAWLNFERAQMGARQQELAEQGSQRVEKAKEQMVNAAVPKQGQTTARTEMWNDSPNAIPDEKFSQMIDLSKAGYGNQLWRSTIGAVLARDHPDVFGPNAP